MKKPRIGGVSRAVLGLAIGLLFWGHPGFSQVSQHPGSLRFRAVAGPKGFSPFPLPLTDEIQALIDSTSLGSKVRDVTDEMRNFGDERLINIPFAEVQGTVFDEEGKPASGIEIVIKNLDSTAAYKVNSGRGGRYDYDGLMPGSYLMVVVNKGEVGLGRTLPLKGDRVTRVDFFLKEFKAMGKPSLLTVARKTRAEVLSTDAESPERNIPNPYRQRYEETLSLADQGRLVKAKDILKGLVEENGNVVAFHYRLGQVHSSLDEYLDAGEQFKKAMELAPQDAGYPALVSHCLLLAYRNFGEAAAMAERAALLDRSAGAVAYYNLGLTLTDQGDLNRAEAAFRRATELSESLSVAFFQLGLTLVSTHPDDIKVARGPLETFLKLVDAFPFSAETPADERQERSEMIDSAKRILGITSGPIRTP